MNKETYNFLKKHNFFKYTNYAKYLETLDKEIERAFDKKSKTRLTIATNKKTQTRNEEFLVMELGGTYLQLYLCENNQNSLTIISLTTFSSSGICISTTSQTVHISILKYSCIA